MLVLFTDTDTDMTPEIAKEYGYKIISMPYSIDGKNIYPYVDFETFDSHAFYDMLRSGVIPNTSALNKEDYLKYFEPEFAAGNDILYVHFSRAMSGSFVSMDQAVEELKIKYPERKFYAIDTKAISIGSLNMLFEIGDMYLAGKSIEEILKWAETEIYHFAIYFFADDLKFFKHSGRVSGLASTMGTLLGIRPIMYISDEGKMVSIGKEKGRTKAIDGLVQYVTELGDDVKGHRVVIANSDTDDIVNEIKAKLIAIYGDDLDVRIVDVNPTSGAHCGPNATGICFHAIHR
ncbi:MAG: DegV family protein [Clostridia bacterium]|nr:DegV family protein [Clostridia bacterium]